jgi:parallel beta-helix repeat protein
VSVGSRANIPTYAQVPHLPTSELSARIVSCVGTHYPTGEETQLINEIVNALGGTFSSVCATAELPTPMAPMNLRVGTAPSPPPPPPLAQCEDGVDNDGDGLIDFPSDPGCNSSSDDDEFNEVVPPPTGEWNYCNIPDPSEHFGFDVFAEYSTDEVITGSHGNYTISGNGSPADPYVVDASGATFSDLTVTGSYIIVNGGTVRSTSESAFSGNANYGVYRGIDVGGNNTNWGHGSGAGLRPNSVWYQGKVHNFGVLNTSQEQDQHGFKLYGPNQWIIEMEGYELSGDGVQIGDASRGSADKVYVAGSYFHDNRENGVDIKDSTGIMICKNRMHGFSPSSSDSGVAMVIHDDAFDAHMAENEIYDTTIGIVSSGARGHIIEDNNIQASRTGIELRNTQNLTVRNNTIDAPTCVNNQSGTSGSIQTGCN